MSSTEQPIDQQPAEKNAEEVAKDLNAEKAERLNSVARKIRAARSAITAKLIRIADLLAAAKDDLRVYDKQGEEDVKKSRASLRSFANSEGMLPRDEFNTLERLASLEMDDRKILTERGSGFAVLKAIADDIGLRQDVIRRMRANIVMDTAAVRRVRLQRKLAAETPLQTFLRLNPESVILESRKETRAAIKAFEKDVASFVVKLGKLAQAGDIGDEEHRAHCDAISPIAVDLLNKLNRFMDVTDLPNDWYTWFRGHQGKGNFSDVAEFVLALQTLASGAVFIPDEDNGGYLETADKNIDHQLVGSIGRLVGISPESLINAPRRGRVRRVSPAEARANAPKLVEPMKLLRSVEICAGAGGQALGLHEAGFRAHAIFEREKDAAETLRQHFHGEVDRVFAEDITKVDFTHYRDRVDLVAGGVPCQPFSTAGAQKGQNDDRDLFRRAVEIVDEIQPRAFFFENVQGLGRSTYLSYRAELTAAFDAIGYQCRLFPILGSDYGLAQGRPRVAFVGFRDPDAMARFQPPPTFPQWGSSLSDAIGDLVSANGWAGYAEWAELANQRCPTIVGGSRKSDKFSFACGHTRETWRLLGIDSTELSATAPSANHRGPFRLTLAMGARIQGFPDGWRFEGKKKQIKSQIGNAFPPVMAKAVGLAIYAALENVEFDYEKALSIGFRTPAAPKLKETVRVREADGRIRLNFGDGSPSLEHRFFDEVRSDDRTGEELIIGPDQYRMRETAE
jgi:DNA (cytosine-5)-methyltransferase 1